MRDHSDYTAEIATGIADRELKQMAKLALVIRENRRSPEWIEKQEARFTGIFKRLLTDPIEEVQRTAGRC